MWGLVRVVWILVEGRCVIGKTDKNDLIRELVGDGLVGCGLDFGLVGFGLVGFGLGGFGLSGFGLSGCGLMWLD